MKTLHDEFLKSLRDQVDESPEKADEILAKLGDKDFLQDLTQDLSADVKQSLFKYVEQGLKDNREQTRQFNERNYNRWKDGFDLLEKLILICIDSGDTFKDDFFSDAEDNPNLCAAVAVRLHARSCHIANEILCLLKAGYADAAQARWRALHEVAVTQLFITKYGDECAQRYVDHEVVESYKGMCQHKEYEHRLQEKGPDDGEIEECKIYVDDLVSTYGKYFKGQYGWALPFINREKGANFSDLEKDVNLDHFRPYYKWASQNIHAGPKGLLGRLGLCEAETDMLLVGPSNSGMTDPAHSTALSLVQTTTNLLVLEPTIDHMVVMMIIGDMAHEIGEAFLKIENEQPSTSP